MSKQLLLVRVSVDRVGQRTTEHNRSSSPPDSRRLTGYNGFAKAKGWKISFPRNRENFAFGREPRVGLGRTRSDALNADTALARLDVISKSPNRKWGSWTLATKIQQTGKPALVPGLGHGAERAWCATGAAPQWPGCGITSRPVRHFCALSPAPITCRIWHPFQKKFVYFHRLRYHGRYRPRCCRCFW
jgi:hypothetical protein